MFEGVSVPSVFFLAGSWWFLAVLGRFLLFLGSDSARCVALLAHTVCKILFTKGA